MTAVLHPQPAHHSVALLSERKHINLGEHRLSSIEGARRVINDISSRRIVNKLTLSYNRLGDAGVVELFRYLRSPEGQKYRIEEIHLARNDLGDDSLRAISEYVKDNTSLKELWLQANQFQGEDSVVTQLAEAINSSHLELLCFSSNVVPSDALISHLLDNLNSPTLHELQFSNTRVTYAVVPHILSYISSPRCHLHTLRASGNNLSTRGVRKIIDAIQASNYTLLKVDLFANDVANEKEKEEGDSDGEGEREWGKLVERLKKTLERNDYIRRQTEREAFTLLRHARAVLLHPPVSSSPTSPSSRLPMELQLHILSFLAPHLSTSQRLRIFNFASNPTTLPRLLPTLQSQTQAADCIPDPASPAFTGGLGMFGMVKPSGSSGCASGKCMGAGNSLICRREGERLKWLAQVGCLSYEP
ncbi:RNI-like protein [Panus rudis PR-1116 ss-1]|nr:RNI-like protein [Panus rudis PR-1116 ss-1]